MQPIVIYFVLLLIPNYVTSETGYSYNFEENFHDLFEHTGLCTYNLETWELGLYSDIEIESPHNDSAKFISPAGWISCISSHQIEMQMDGALDVYIYMVAELNSDQVRIVIYEFVEEHNLIINDAYLRPTNADFITGWNIISVTVTRTGLFRIAFMAIADTSSIILVDSFQYISPIISIDQEELEELVESKEDQPLGASGELGLEESEETEEDNEQHVESGEIESAEEEHNQQPGESGGTESLEEENNQQLEESDGIGSEEDYQLSKESEIIKSVEEENNQLSRESDGIGSEEENNSLPGESEGIESAEGGNQSPGESEGTESVEEEKNQTTEESEEIGSAEEENNQLPGESGVIDVEENQPLEKSKEDTEELESPETDPVDINDTNSNALLVSLTVILSLVVVGLLWKLFLEIRKNIAVNNV